jgi:hypothetical protein
MWMVTALVLAAPAFWLFGPTQAVTSVMPGQAEWLADPGHLPDPRTATAAQVADYFAGLSPTAAGDLVRRHPEVVGNLDGVPAALRYSANVDPRWPYRQFLASDRRGERPGRGGPG